MKLSLPDVCLFAIDTAQVNLTIKSMMKCMDACDFGDVFLVTNRPIKAHFRVEVVPELSSREYVGKFIVNGLDKFIKKPFALGAGWDGWIINPEVWNNNFLNYDYIGAKWPWHKDGMNVGNSGFSLRSKKLTSIMESMPVHLGETAADDVYICRTIRPMLEKQHGIRFAEETVADLFSYERSIPEQKTFGFHGLFNVWRHAMDVELIEIAETIGGYKLLNIDYIEIVMHLYLLRKFNVLEAFYRRLKKAFSLEEITNNMAKYISNNELLFSCISCCENFYKKGLT